VLFSPKKLFFFVRGFYFTFENEFEFEFLGKKLKSKFLWASFFFEVKFQKEAKIIDLFLRLIFKFNSKH
jgi:hypothetical protein